MAANAFHMNPNAEFEIERIGQRVQENVLEEIAQDAKDNAPIQTGHLKESISVEGDRVVAKADYARYVELGTSKMHAQPFLRPALYKRRNLRAEEHGV